MAVTATPPHRFLITGIDALLFVAAIARTQLAGACREAAH
jgi:hypothetical protein